MFAFLRSILHNCFMVRRINRALLDKWLEQNGPDGISKLAVKSSVSSSTIQKARAMEKAPGKLLTLQRLSRAMKCELDDLFPLVDASENEIPVAKKRRRG